jgi:hypothetical protein
MARAATVAGVAMRWVLPAALAVVGLVAVVGWLMSNQASDHARRAVQAWFVNPETSRRTARVDSCDQIAANTEARIYLCDVTATNCTRFFQFAVYRESTYGATPVFAPTFALRHPCTPIHT